MKPSVSVVVPVYNGGRYIEETLASIVGQTIKDIEIICVDDGSTDNSTDIIEREIARDSRIKLIKQKQLYAGVARNAGMEIASGKYLCFLDADDVFEKDMLQTMVERAEETMADIVYCSVDTFTNSITQRKAAPYFNNLLPISDSASPYCFSPRHDARLDAFRLTTPAPWNKLFRHDFIKRHNLTFAAHKSTNDLEFVCTAISLAKKMSCVDRVLVHYRLRTDSISHTSKKDPELHAKAFLQFQEKLKEKKVYSAFENAFKIRLIDSEAWHFHTLDHLNAQNYVKEWKARWAPIFNLSPASNKHLYHTDRRCYLYQCIFEPYVSFIASNKQEVDLLLQGKMLDDFEAPYEILLSTSDVDEIDINIRKTKAWHGKRILPVIINKDDNYDSIIQKSKSIARGEKVVSLAELPKNWSLLKNLKWKRQKLRWLKRYYKLRYGLSSGRRKDFFHQVIVLLKRQIDELSLCIKFLKTL